MAQRVVERAGGGKEVDTGRSDVKNCLQCPLVGTRLQCYEEAEHRVNQRRFDNDKCSDFYGIRTLVVFLDDEREKCRWQDAGATRLVCFTKFTCLRANQ